MKRKFFIFLGLSMTSLVLFAGIYYFLFHSFIGETLIGRVELYIVNNSKKDIKHGQLLVNPMVKNSNQYYLDFGKIKRGDSELVTTYIENDIVVKKITIQYKSKKIETKIRKHGELISMGEYASIVINDDGSVKWKWGKP